MKNIMLYDRIITAYEGNTLDVKNGVIFINSKETTSYTFKMNYYFMMGRNTYREPAGGDPRPQGPDPAPEPEIAVRPGGGTAGGSG